MPTTILRSEHIPAGVSGDSVFIGISVPRTGTYAVQGEDELKGYELAIEHINSGHDLIKKISPKTTKGVLGKELKYGVADSAAKPNEAVQAQQRFISENKAMMITGGTSSAVCGRTETSWRSARRCCSSAASPARTTRPARTACVTVSASASLDRPRRRRSARSWSRLRQNKKAAYLTPGLYLRSHRYEVDAGLSGNRWMDHGD